MIQKKICMLGASGVGKTSLVRRFVYSIFSEKYHSTIGVKIDKRGVEIQGKQVSLVLWDIAGEEEFFKIPMAYVRGAAGYLLVIDGTRASTLEQALEVQERVESVIGDVPLVIVLNKADLVDAWQLSEHAIETLRERLWPVVRSSAKTGSGVEEAFDTLARRILGL